MDDKTAIKNLTRWENVNTRVTYTYAIYAIERLARVRAILLQHERNELEQSEAFDKILEVLKP